MSPFSLQSILSLTLSLLVVIAVVAGAWTLRRWQLQARCDAQRMFEQLDLVRAELMLLADRVQGMAVHAPPVMQRPAPIEVKAPPAVAAAPAPRGYEIAARLARGGATCDELISSCGLSRHEAELLMRLNKAEVARAKPEVARPKPEVARSKPVANTSPTRAEVVQRKSLDATRARLAAVV